MKSRYNFAFFDEGSKREIRRATLKAVAVPGFQVPFASREMPIARGWGTGGLQLTLSLVGRSDVLKVIDQGADESVNAVNIQKFVALTAGVETTVDPSLATIIQSRHRIPEQALREGQILVLQVPIPEPLRLTEPSELKTRRLHADREYTGAYLLLFEEIMKHGMLGGGADHPVEVNGRYVMAPSPIPRFDNPKLDACPALALFGAGREKKIYAVPPYTKVRSLDFLDHPFRAESFDGKRCRLCGAEGVYLDELYDAGSGRTEYQCNDSHWCSSRRMPGRAAGSGPAAGAGPASAEGS